MTSFTPDRERILDVLEQVASVGVPGAGSDLLDVGHEAFLAHFEREVLEGLVLAGGSTCRIFEGPYGSGKTHLLNLLQQLAWRKGMAVAKADLSQDLSLENWRGLAVHLLQNLELHAEGQTYRSLPAILEQIARRDAGAADRLRRVRLPHEGVRNAMAQLLSQHELPSQARLILRRFLLGEKVSAAEVRKAGSIGIRDPLSARNAEQVLNSVLAGLRHAGIPGTLLLFDEHEKSLIFVGTSIVPRRVQVAANLMRRLIDGCADGAVVATVSVFAVLPGFLDQCSRAYPALGQRVAAPPDDGRPMSWRWPALRVDSLACGGDFDRFASEAVRSFAQLAQSFPGVPDSLSHELQDAAVEVLRKNASAGFRRELFKRLSTMTLQAIEASPHSEGAR